ncbi:MAG: alpha/beta hydrolase [Clostridia bacterium]|nr:alpha/beta hydrolase [Clostridia bacterium]
MKKETFTSYDGKELACFLWDDVQNPKGVIQIIHGMTSHMQRYKELGETLNRYGYIAYGDDHRPHGETAGIENLGKAEKNNYEENVQDEIAITQMLKKRYGLPVQLFAHSYGSFLAQTYLTRRSDLLEGVILSGSSHMGGARLKFGKVLTSLQRIKYKMDEPNLMLFRMTFEANNKPFAGEGLLNAWLNRDKDKVALYNKDPYCNFYMTHGFYYSMMRGLTETYKKAALSKIRKNLPIYIISGSRDPLGGMGKKVTKLYHAYQSLGLNVKMKLYEDARHELTSDFEKDTVISDMVRFYDGNVGK